MELNLNQTLEIIDVTVEDNTQNISLNIIVGSMDSVDWSQVTTKPTTIAGYGITDAAIQSEVDLNTAKETNIAHPLVETAVPLGALFTDTIYTHPTGDGNKHIPANSTTNDGKVLTASATPGVYTWELPVSGSGGGVTDHTLLSNIGTKTHATLDSEVDINNAKVSNIAHPLVETAVPLGALFTDTDTDTIYDDTVIQSEVDLNTAKTGITTQQASNITNNNSKVSNIAHPLVETAVPINALFTDNDTVYDDTAIQSEVDLNTAKETNIAHPLVETAVPVGALFTDTDTIYNDTTIQNEVDLNTADRHNHLNKPTLDKFGEDGSGLPTYNGVKVDTTIAQRDVYDGLDSLDNTISLSANSGKVLKDVQDTQQTAINLNNAKVSNINHPLVEKAVPLNALFTDTVYDDTAIQGEVDLNTAKVSNVVHPLVETAVPVGAVFTDTDTVYDDTTIQGEVDLNTAKTGITTQQASDITTNNGKVSNVAHPLVETAVPVGAVFTDTDTVYDSTSVDNHIADTTTNPHNVDKTDVGLSNVDNTSDTAKPVSTAQQTESNTKLDKSVDIQVLWSGTQAEYDLIGTPSETTIYFIE